MTDPDAAPKITAPAVPLTGPGGAPPQVPALRQTAATAAVPGRRAWVWAGLGVLVLGIGALLWVQPWAARVPLVAVETVLAAPTTRVLAVNGRIAAASSVDVRPLVGGTIDRLTVAEGDVVEPGQTLAHIKSDAQNATVRQAVAALDAALVAQAGAQDAFDRATALGGTVARSTLDTQDRALQSAAQEVARLTAAVDLAQIALGNTTIRAPIAGTVLRRTVDPGQVVDASTVLLTLADLTDPVVETDVDEAYATRIIRGQSATLQLAGETQTRAGQVTLVSARVDVATGGLAVTLGFDTPVAAPVGLTVTANIVVDQQDAALTVPRTALVDGAVFVVQGDIARRRAVQVVDWPAARLIVTEGLVAGDVLIVDAAGMADGMAVRVEAP